MPSGVSGQSVESGRVCAYLRQCKYVYSAMRKREGCSHRGFKEEESGQSHRFSSLVVCVCWVFLRETRE
jgi:hypothetical protein